MVQGVSDALSLWVLKFWGWGKIYFVSQVTKAPIGKELRFGVGRLTNSRL